MQIPGTILEDIVSLAPCSLIAISGYGGAGKSTVASAIGELTGFPVVGVDAFITDKNLSDYRLWELIDFPRLEREVIIPFRRGRPIRYGIFDWEANAVLTKRELSAPRHLIVEGVGLFRPTLLKYFALKIWVNCDLEEAIRRGKSRDRVVHNNPQDESWNGIWKRNDQECFRVFRPTSVADHILENAAEPSM